MNVTWNFYNKEGSHSGSFSACPQQNACWKGRYIYYIWNDRKQDNISTWPWNDVRPKFVNVIIIELMLSWIFGFRMGTYICVPLLYEILKAVAFYGNFCVLVLKLILVWQRQKIGVSFSPGDNSIKEERMVWKCSRSGMGKKCIRKRHFFLSEEWEIDLTSKWSGLDFISMK